MFAWHYVEESVELDKTENRTETVREAPVDTCHRKLALMYLLPK